jgi:hypothetical protein
MPSHQSPVNAGYRLFIEDVFLVKASQMPHFSALNNVVSHILFE